MPPDLQGPVGEQRDVIAIVRGLLAQIQLRHRCAEVHHLRRDAAVGAGESLDGGLIARVGIRLRARARQPGAGKDAPVGPQARGAHEIIEEQLSSRRRGRRRRRRRRSGRAQPEGRQPIGSDEEDAAGCDRVVVLAADLQLRGRAGEEHPHRQTVDGVQRRVRRRGGGQRAGAIDVGVDHPHDGVRRPIAGDDRRARIPQRKRVLVGVDCQVCWLAGARDHFHAREPRRLRLGTGDAGLGRAAEEEIARPVRGAEVGRRGSRLRQIDVVVVIRVGSEHVQGPPRVAVVRAQVGAEQRSVGGSGHRVGPVAVRPAGEATRQVVAIEQVQVALLAPQRDQVRSAGPGRVEIGQQHRRPAREIDIEVIELTVVPGRVGRDQAQRQRGSEREQRFSPVTIERP